MKKIKKNKRLNANSYQEDDIRAMRGKGTRKEDRRAKRSKEKQGLNDIAHGHLDPDEYLDYMDDLNSN